MTNPRLVGLQALRAVAALMVVFHHARLSVPGSGFLTTAGEGGVDVFFVISGFVMAYSTARLPAGSGLAERAGAAREFIVNRVLRVVPLYWLILAWTAHRGYGTRFTATSLLQDLFFLPHPSAEYPGMMFPLLVQGWTLNYEMFFYALFAAALLGGRAARRIVVAVIVALVGAGLALAIVHGPPPADLTQQVVDLRLGGANVWASFYTNSVMLEFGLGIVLAARAPFPAWPRRAFVLLLLVGFAWLALAHLHWPRGLMQGLPAALIVWAGIPAFAGARVPRLERLGDASYSIYLVHWSSFAALKPLVARAAGATLAPWASLGLVLAHMAVAVGVGLVVHVLVEKPLTRRLRHRFARGAPRGTVHA